MSKFSSQWEGCRSVGETGLCFPCGNKEKDLGFRCFCPREPGSDGSRRFHAGVRILGKWGKDSGTVEKLLIIGFARITGADDFLHLFSIVCIRHCWLWFIGTVVFDSEVNVDVEYPLPTHFTYEEIGAATLRI